MGEIGWTIWGAIGIVSHIFWWDLITDGKWDGPAIPLCVMLSFHAIIFGPLTFVIEGLIFAGLRRL